MSNHAEYIAQSLLVFFIPGARTDRERGHQCQQSTRVPLFLQVHRQPGRYGHKPPHGVDVETLRRGCELGRFEVQQSGHSHELGRSHASRQNEPLRGS